MGMKLKCCVTVAGSDSGGGAGIQADLKVFSAFGVYGASVVTAVTAQNTLGVRAVEEVSPEMVGAQLEAVLEDLGADAVKVGMVSSAGAIEAIAATLERCPHGPVVLDPLMVSKNGVRLLREEACGALVGRLFPLARLVTPNVPEAECLTGMRIVSREDMVRASEALLGLGAQAVLVKGGHFGGASSDDLLNDGGRLHWLGGERLAARHTHGTGCTLSSAIAAQVALGVPLPVSCASAKSYVRRAMSAGLSLGGGCGPLHHFVDWYGGEKGGDD